MFLQSEDHNIDDFLKAVNFIAPQGFNLKYFIVPYAANNTILAGGAAQNGFEVTQPEPNSQDVKGITDTITYLRKDMKNRQSFNDSNFNLNQIPNEFPITRPQEMPSNLEPLQTDLIAAGTEIKSPIAGVKVLESQKEYIDMKLDEDVGCFPKHTILHFTKEKLKESFDRIGTADKYSAEEKVWINELCDRCISAMRDNGFEDSIVRDALFFCCFTDEFLLKGHYIEWAIKETGITDEQELWDYICTQTAMRKLGDITEAIELKNGCQLTIAWR